MLTILDNLPEGLLDKKAHELSEALSGPTLIHLPGIKHRPLFVSVLLHGNESTGWEAIRQYLSNFLSKLGDLPRALSLFIGNISAAREHKRVLDGQLDYNRVWFNHASEEGKMMTQILSQMKDKHVFASIDIHNNTGKNPHYACINRKEHDFFQLAHLFSRTVVYFIKPDSVQSMAFSKLCPAVTVECGQAEDEQGVQHAISYIEKAMNLGEFTNQPLKAEDFDLYHTMAIVKVPEELKISFDPTDRADINFAPDVDKLNFLALKRGELLAKINSDNEVYLQAINEQGIDVAPRYFDFSHGEIRTRIPVMPSMLTTKEEIIRQDCLCYLMEKIDFEEVEN